MEIPCASRWSSSPALYEGWMYTFVPPDNRRNHPEIRLTRQYIINRLLTALDQTTTPAERDAYFEKVLQSSEVSREGNLDTNSVFKSSFLSRTREDVLTILSERFFNGLLHV
jgi:hypothetical protein